MVSAVVTLELSALQYSSVNSPHSPSYSPCPRFVVEPEILTSEINWTSLSAVNSNHTSSSSPIQELESGEADAAVIVPGFKSSQDSSIFTIASSAPLQLSLAGGQANSWIALLFITQFTSWSLATEITISVRKG